MVVGIGIDLGIYRVISEFYFLAPRIHLENIQAWLEGQTVVDEKFAFLLPRSQGFHVLIMAAVLDAKKLWRGPGREFQDEMTKGYS